MQEYIIGCEGIWWHFFYKPSYGLCFRKKDGAHFNEFEILLKDTAQDFCVLSLGNSIHVVCQDGSGSILYLKYSGGKWEKLTLLAAKTPSPYPKHFRLISVGNFINLYYIIEYKEKYMLVHQILDSTAEPTVVDYITMSSQPFSVCSHSSTDLSVCYSNSRGICGMRIFRWSQKSYSPFTRIIHESPLSSPVIQINEEDTCFFAAAAKLDTLYNLIFLRREPDGSFSEPSTVYLDCGENPQPILFTHGERLYLQWVEAGSVMMSYSDDYGHKWKKPAKYMRGNATTVTLYNICTNSGCSSCYGFSDNGTINMYCEDNPLLQPPPQQLKKGFRPRGSDAADFARSFGYRRPPEIMPEPEYVSKEELYRELMSLKEMLSRHDAAISTLLDRSEPTQEIPLAENEEDIDRIIIENTSCNNSEPEIPVVHTAKIVVTGQ